MREAGDPDVLERGASLHVASACTVDKGSGIGACWPKCISLNSRKAAYLEGCLDKLKFSTKGKPYQWSLVFLTLVLSAHVLHHHLFFLFFFCFVFRLISIFRNDTHFSTYVITER